MYFATGLRNGRVANIDRHQAVVNAYDCISGPPMWRVQLWVPKVFAKPHTVQDHNEQHIIATVSHSTRPYRTTLSPQLYLRLRESRTFCCINDLTGSRNSPELIG